MRIVILTQYYPPEIGAPQNRLSDLARRLAARGHHVQVLTAMPNYPGAEVLPGYRGKTVLEEEMDCVTVRRVSLYVPRKKTFSRRILNYCSFALHACWRGPALLQPADFVVTESPPLFLGPAGVYVAKRLKARFVFNVSDLWPDSAIALGFLKPGAAARVAKEMEEWCYRRADLITGQSEGTVKSIRARVPGKRVELLPNGVYVERWQRRPDRSAVRREFGYTPSDFVAGYAGLHGHAQALEQVLPAARMLAAEENIRFVFFGDGPCKESLMSQVREQRLANVAFHPPQPAERMPEILSALDAGLVTLARGPVFEGVIPSKIFEVMAAGKPVVLAANGEAGRLVAAARCGVVTPPEAPERLAEVIRRLSRDARFCAELGENGRRCVAKQFNRATIAANFENLLRSLDAEARGPAALRSPLPESFENSAPNEAAVESLTSRKRVVLLKAAFDRLVAAAGLILLSPVLLTIAAAIAVEDSLPVFFRQVRIGRGGRPFQILKFRSMRAGVAGPRITAANDARLTRVGNLLRRYKLDELPQLWNVLKGQMSLVGPRPEVPAFVDPSDPAWQAVLAAKPGITDVASLVYRNEEEILAGRSDPEDYYREVVLPEKLAINLQYIANSSFWRDLRLIMQTVRYSLSPAGFDPDRARRRFFSQERT